VNFRVESDINAAQYKVLKFCVRKRSYELFFLDDILANLNVHAANFIN
jgi:hypothetical protein